MLKRARSGRAWFRPPSYLGSAAGARDDDVHPPRSIAALAIGLAKLGALGFGGVGPQAYHYFVERYRWLSADEFAERLSIAQALPGANVVNLCAIVGDAWFGPLGAVAAVGAIAGPPLVVVLIAASALARIAHAPRVLSIECAVVAASAGLILATALRVLTTIARRRAIALGLATAVALMVGLRVVSMPVATLIGIAAGFAIDRSARS